MRVLLLLLAGCSIEWNLAEKDAETVFDDGEPPDTDTDPPAEVCNGLDDDGDGEVDEGFDADGNGRGDCHDEECPALVLGAAASGLVSDECIAGRRVEDPWNVVVEWQYQVGAGWGPVAMPAVGNMTDDNGDGLVDAQDVPDIAFPNWVSPDTDPNILVLISGDGSGLHYEHTGMGNCQGVAIADVDSDGFPDVISFSDADRVVAVDTAGVTKWESEAVRLLAHRRPADGSGSRG